MYDHKALLIEKLRHLLLHMAQDGDVWPKKKSAYISEQLNYDYTYLANLFSATIGITIEQYLIVQRVERVSELLLSGELSLTQIADKLNYSSVAHVSNQFRKVTGITPTFFRQLIHQQLQAQPDEVRFFDQLNELFAWALSGRQRQSYHRSLESGHTLMITNLLQTILWVSRCFWTMTGYRPMDVVGKTPHFLQGPGTDALTRQFIRGQLQRRQEVETELVNYRRNGELYLCYLKIEPLPNKQGKLTHFLAVEYEIKACV
ncbi:helix-turn-helix domain-containing protein [Spirosoma areae]